jgi:hypothetical protein
LPPSLTLNASHSSKNQLYHPPQQLKNNPPGRPIRAIPAFGFERRGADNGIGIPKEAHERIFKLFQRLNPACEDPGLGLTVVRRAVEKMGGWMGLESEPGRGRRLWPELYAAGSNTPPR